VFTIPIYAFTMTDPGVHDGVIFVFTMERSGRSRWTETRTLGLSWVWWGLVWSPWAQFRAQWASGGEADFI